LAGCDGCGRGEGDAGKKLDRESEHKSGVMFPSSPGRLPIMAPVGAAGLPDRLAVFIAKDESVLSAMDLASEDGIHVLEVNL